MDEQRNYHGGGMTMMAQELAAGDTVVLPVDMAPFGYSTLKIHRVLHTVTDGDTTLLTVVWGYKPQRTVAVPSRRPMATDMSFPE